MKTACTALATAFLAAFCAASAFAKVDLVILPSRDSVQLTIYNGADLTLVREKRNLTLKRGRNRLEFSWADTLIDPTSLEMRPLAEAGKIDVLDLTYPPRVRNSGIWHVRSEESGKVPVEISYLTSGLSWRAFYMGTLSRDESRMRLQGYVRVSNRSGEDYRDAKVRVVVGRINLIDRIADLAKRGEPYGRPAPQKPDRTRQAKRALRGAEAKMSLAAESTVPAKPKEIAKEGLSEYYLYSIEGTETVPDGWSKRLPSMDVTGIPVENIYKYDERRFGTRAVRFLGFENDREHGLGETPLPGGTLRAYRVIDPSTKRLSYEGRSTFKYVPVDEEAELNLGPARRVLVEPVLMDEDSGRYLFDENGDIAGWDERRTYEIRVRNTRSIPVKVEIKRHFDARSWEIEPQGDFDEFAKVDRDTVRFGLELGPQQDSSFGYTLTVHHGRRAD
jgi:hypothetical protein